MKCGLLRPCHVEETVNIMVGARATYAGLCTKQLCLALCRDALADADHRHIMFIIAENNAEVAGYVVATVGRQNYAAHFARRHPLIMVQALWHRSRKRLRRIGTWKKPAEPGRHAELTNELPVISGSSRLWKERASHIAKIIHIGIRPDMRRLGVATELYDCLYKSLKQIGVTRVDAHIDMNNIASIKLHHRAGWTISRTGSHLLATIDLPT